MELHTLTVKEILAGIKEKKFSEEEIYSAFHKRIASHNKSLNIYITVCNKPYKSDNPEKNDLIGVPVGVKDMFVTKGLRTTAGSRVLDSYIPEYSGTVVSRLLNTGASIIGKTNQDAWAHGSSGENSDYGSTRNPWNTEYVPGGSSSGSAASVAADMNSVALGTDTGGSIRTPASFCGVVGLKPTYGRFSRYGVIAMASSLDSPGVFTHTVDDAEYVFNLLAGKDAYDATTLSTPSKPVPSKIRIGIPKEYFGSGLDPEVRIIVENAIAEIKKLPFVSEFVEVSLPHTEYGIATYYMVMTSEVSSNLARYDGIRYGRDRSFFAEETKRRIMLGTYALSAGYYDAYYKKAMKVRTLIKQDFDRVFEKVDVLIAPVSPTPPFKLGEKVSDPMAMYLSDVLTVNANLAGIPGLALPAGFTKTGLPVGMQFLGPQMGEEILFSLGKKYQEITDWHLKKPSI